MNKARLTKYKPFVVYTLAIAAVIAAVVAAVWGMWQLLGPLNTIVYLFVFVLGLVLIPTIVTFAGGMTPNVLATLNDILGSLAFGRTALVQRDDRWELAPAEENRVYIDGAWHRIEGGLDNWSFYAWRPFAILRFKDDDTLHAVRSDTAAEHHTGRGASEWAADGGAATVKRGGVTRADPPAVSGTDGWWLVDLTRLFSRGIRQMGNIDLIEKAEEVAQRRHASEGLTRGHEAMVALIISLLLGVGTGVVLFGYI